MQALTHEGMSDLPGKLVQRFPGQLNYVPASSLSSTLALDARVCAPSTSPETSACLACFKNSLICAAVCSESLNVRPMPFNPRSVAAIESSACRLRSDGSPEESLPMALTSGLSV